MLRLKYNPKRKRAEYALMSVSSPGKVLRWFGPRKPNPDRVAAEERRVEYFKHQKGA